MTNEKLILSMMRHSNHGALSQIFIMDALYKVAKMVSDLPVEKVRAQFGENAFVHPDAWHAVATEIRKRIEAR